MREIPDVLLSLHTCSFRYQTQKNISGADFHVHDPLVKYGALLNTHTHTALSSTTFV